jgi:methylated-DNA-[protein]-cysteine S-methyltransferase
MSPASADAPTYTIAYDSPIGRLLIHSDGDHLIGLDIVPEATRPLTNHLPHQSSDPIITDTVGQLAEYFSGARTAFDIPTAVVGTPFQQKIWAALTRIPFGHTQSYQELGQAAGVGKAPRAVGGAVGKNPIAIVIPCHRVLGKTGTITGYSGGEGIVTKEHLLRLENIPYRNTSKTSSVPSPARSNR